MKLTGCLLMVLGFFGCSEKTEEQVELEEIVHCEVVGKTEQIQGKIGQADLPQKEFSYEFEKSFHLSEPFLRNGCG